MIIMNVAKLQTEYMEAAQIYEFIHRLHETKTANTTELLAATVQRA
jgi:hypothetical protein